jgi:hypothetical protein
MIGAKDSEFARVALQGLFAAGLPSHNNPSIVVVMFGRGRFAGKREFERR